MPGRHKATMKHSAQCVCVHVYKFVFLCVCVCVSTFVQLPYFSIVYNCGFARSFNRPNLSFISVNFSLHTHTWCMVECGEQSLIYAMQ